MRTESSRTATRIAVSFVVLVPLACCEEIGSFSTAEGEVWRGAAVDAEIVRKGFETGTVLEMTFDSESLDESPGTITTLAADGSAVTFFDHAPLIPIAALKHDSLSGFDFPSGRLRNYMFFAPAGDPFGGIPAVVVVSLLSDGDVEVRIILGGENLYGIFILQKQAVME